MGSKFASLFGGMFGGRKGEATDSGKPESATEYKGYSIRPLPRHQGSVWLLAGVITKEFPDGMKEHQFVRADTYTSRDDAVSFAVTKGKQIIDEQGDRMFGG